MEHAGFSWGPGEAPPLDLADMNEDVYKQAKENFVAGQSGGSLSEVMALMMVNAVSAALAARQFPRAYQPPFLQSSALFARVFFSFLNANEYLDVNKVRAAGQCRATKPPSSACR